MQLALLGTSLDHYSYGYELTSAILNNDYLRTKLLLESGLVPSIRIETERKFRHEIKDEDIRKLISKTITPFRIFYAAIIIFCSLWVALVTTIIIIKIGVITWAN